MLGVGFLPNLGFCLAVAAVVFDCSTDHKSSVNGWLVGVFGPPVRSSLPGMNESNTHSYAYVQS